MTERLNGWTQRREREMARREAAGRRTRVLDETVRTVAAYYAVDRSDRDLLELWACEGINAPVVLGRIRVEFARIWAEQ